MAKHSLIVDEQKIGLRLDVFLTQECPSLPSRAYAQRLIEAGQVTINDKIVKAHYKVNLKDRIDVEVVLKDIAAPVTAENIPLNIFYEDEYLLVVNKPVGMLVHPVHGYHGGTLVNALMHHCQTLSDVNTPEEEEEIPSPATVRPGIVHRLDRETSGLLVVAKDNVTHVQLAKQFERRQVKKKYLALVAGHIPFDEGMVDAALTRHPKHWDKKAVAKDDSGKAAVTIYRVLQRMLGNKTLVALYPQSGRTHQLRVHMAHIKHPILGDEKYGDAKAFPRMALHAQSLGFKHPHLGIFMEFSTPIPEEFLT